MRKKARCLYIDDATFNNIVKLAGLKRISLSAMVIIIINDAFYARYHLDPPITYACSKCGYCDWFGTSDAVRINNLDPDENVIVSGSKFANNPHSHHTL